MNSILAAEMLEIYDDNDVSDKVIKNKYKLTYFNIKGLAETTRLIFAIAGEEYEDFRYELEVINMAKYEFKKDQFDNDKECGKLKLSLNKLPFLTINDKVLCQSKAIERYLAREFNLMGISNIESAMIDSLCECIRDFKDAYQIVRKAENKEEAMNHWFTESLKEKMEMFENLLGNNTGFSVGNQLSLSDIIIYSFIKEFFDDKLSALSACANCPKVNSILNNVSNNDNLKKWLDNRPITVF
mgnify:CR=1 FL=1